MNGPLCQTCGYDLAGLPRSVPVCPECGRRIAPTAGGDLPFGRLIGLAVGPCVVLVLMALGTSAVAPGNRFSANLASALMVGAFICAGVAPLVAVAMGLGEIGSRLRGHHLAVALCCLMGTWFANGVVCVVVFVFGALVWLARYT